jgi:hypothetical protein
MTAIEAPVNPYGINCEGQHSPEGLEFSPLEQSLS